MNTAVKRITAFNYFGGKTRHLDWLLPLFPPVTTYVHYVSVFAGSAPEFFNKDASRIETINDIDGNLINFFTVLRDKPELLIQKLELTPYSRTEFIAALDPAGDDVERARKFFIRIMQTFGGAGYSTTRINSWRTQFKEWRYGLSLEVSKWLDKIYGLKECVIRLRMAQIENRSFDYVIKSYDNSDTFFYCDPPYPHSTRSSNHNKDYKHEFTDKQHRQLARLLYKAKGKWALSSYESELYEKLYAGRGYFKTLGPARMTNLGKKKVKREVLWTNYDPELYKSLKLF